MTALLTIHGHVGGRALYITGSKTGEILAAAAPDVPTVAESGLPRYEAISWQGLVAPAKTDRSVIDRLNGALKKAAGSKKLEDKVAENGMDLRISSPEELRDLIAREQKKYAGIVKRTKAKVE